MPAENFSNFWAQKFHFLRFPREISQQINTRENVIVICLIYISGVTGNSVYGKSEKGKTVTPSRRYKQRVRYLPFRRANKPIKCDRFISHSDLMIKMLTLSKLIFFSL